MVVPLAAIPVNFANGKTGRSKRRLRERLFQRQDGKCYWCKEEMELEHFVNTKLGNLKENPRFATIEHLLPKYRGGLNGADNCVAAHAHCNHKRPQKKWPHDPVYGGIRNRPELVRRKVPKPLVRDIPLLTEGWHRANVRAQMPCDWPWLAELVSPRVRDVGWGPWT